MTRGAPEPVQPVARGAEGSARTVPGVTSQQTTGARPGIVARLSANWPWLIGALGIIQLVLQLHQGLRGVEHIVIVLFQDDTFYYLQPAWNLHRVGMVTFDGIHPTSGVQLLWFAMVAALAWLAPTKSALVTLTACSCAVLNALGHAAILGAGRQLRRPSLAVSVSALWCAVVLAGPTYLRGMENSLHAAVSWAIVWQLAAFLRNLKDRSRASLVPLTTLLILNTWTRLDSVIVSAVVFACCVGARMAGGGSCSRSAAERARVLLGPIGLVLLGGAFQLAAYHWMAGSVIPVSALMKSQAFTPLEEGGLPGRLEELVSRSYFDVDVPLHLPPAAGTVLLWFGGACVLVGPLLLRRIGGRGIGSLRAFALGLAAAAVLWVVVPGGVAAVEWLACLALTAFVAYWHSIRRPGEIDLSLPLWSILAAAFVAYHTLVLPLGMRPGFYSPWYQAPAHVFWITSCGFFVTIAAQLAGDALGRRTIALGAGAVLAAGIGGALVASVRGYEPMPMAAARYRAARHIDEHAPADTILASWNAGLLGYFTNRPTINLDGLVNTVEYARSLLSGKLDLVRYLREQRVDYVIDWVVPADVLPALDPVVVFEVHPGWKPIVLYEVRPMDGGPPVGDPSSDG